MKMVLTSATDPESYVQCLSGWQQRYVLALRALVHEAAPGLEERLKWGHLVVFHQGGPVLLIRAEPARVLFGFWRGRRMTHIDPRLKGGGKYEMASLELREDTPLARDVALRLVREAVRLAAEHGDPTKLSPPGSAPRARTAPAR